MKRVLIDLKPRHIGYGLFLLGLFALSQADQAGGAEILSADRRIVWQGNVGVKGGIPTVSTVFTTLTPSGGNDLTQIQQALQNCPANQAVVLAPGTFVMSGTLDYASIGSGKVLRGSGPANTILRWNSAGGSACILMRSVYSSSAIATGVPLVADAVKDQNTLTVESVPSWIKPSHLYVVDQLDDPSFVTRGSTAIFENGEDFRSDFVTTTWGNRGLAQLVKVVSISGNTITTEVPLYYGFRTSFAARFWGAGYNAASVNPLRRCGIENLAIAPTFISSSIQTIKMENTDECWLRNVKSELCPGQTHVMLIFSYRNEISDSSFMDAKLYGPGQGYGVAIYNNCSGNLIQNNIFRGLHASMQANYGSSGNVFGYNYAFQGKADSGNDPGISFHGTHSYMNLCEGNFCAMRVEGDVVHGSSSHQFLFRNRLAGYEPGKTDDQTAVEFDYYNRKCSVVGNVLGVSGVHTIYQRADGQSCTSWGDRIVYKLGYVNPWGCNSRLFDSLSVNGILRHLNWDATTTANNGVVVDPNISERNLPNSYYLSTKPAWFGDRPWPPFSPFSPSSAVPTNLPAGFRYVFGSGPPTGNKPVPPANLRVLPD